MLIGAYRNGVEQEGAAAHLGDPFPHGKFPNPIPWMKPAAHLAQGRGEGEQIFLGHGIGDHRVPS